MKEKTNRRVQLRHEVSDYGKVDRVVPWLVRQNNSNKKWYKTHVPKSMRRGLTNREKTTVRRSVYSGRY